MRTTRLEIFRRALKLQIILALALRASGDLRGAIDEFAAALDYAAVDGFVSTFVDEGAGVGVLLPSSPPLPGIGC